MKKLFTLLIISLISISTYAQGSSNDIIYPIDESKPIKNCKIINIENGNMVFYLLNGNEKSIKAMLVKKNGEYIDLSEDEAKTKETDQNNISPKLTREENIKDQDYNYYHQEYTSGQKRKKLGLVISTIGAGFSFFGYTTFNKGESSNNDTASSLGAVLTLSGITMVAVGVPLWISGEIKSARNKKEMEKHSAPNMSLNIGISKNGIGLVFTF